MSRGARCHCRQRARHPVRARWVTGRVGATRSRSCLRRALSRRRTLRRSPHLCRLCESFPFRLRRRGELRRHRRLRPSGLRTVCQNQAGKGRPLAHYAPAHCATLSHECRHDRRGGYGQSAAGPLPHIRQRHPPGWTAARQGRGIFHRDPRSRRHVRVCRRGPEIRGAGGR